MFRGEFIGIFFMALFGLRFLIEFIKEPQVGFEENMVLNMGQWLSVPFILLGVAILVYSLVRKQPAEVEQPQKKKSTQTHFAKSVSK